MRLLYKTYLTVILLSCIVFAQQRVIDGKVINKNERWSGVIILTGDVVISKSGRLVIDPGTRVLFQPETDKTSGGKDKTRSEIVVNGSLIARGAINNKIVFTSNSTNQRMGDWYGISITGGKQISIFDYVTIEYAFDGLRIKKSAPQVNNSVFRYNYNAGIFADMKANPKIIGNIISENGYAGIICKLGAKPILSENLITGNQIGLIIYSSSQPNMGNMQEGPDYNIGKNRLFDNLEYNVYNHGSKDIYAANNFWGSESTTDISGTIFDNNNDRKYGLVSYTPILGSERSDLNNFIRVSQETTTQTDAASTGLLAAAQPATQGSVVPEEAQTVDEEQDNPDQQPNAADEQPEQPALKHRTIDEMLGTLAVNEAPAAETKAEPEPVVEEPVKEPEIDYNQVFLDAFLDNGKKITKTVAPVLSDDRVWVVQGRVIVRVVVGKDGKVESTQLLRGLNEYLDGVALEAAQKFEFEPGTVNGNGVRFSTNVVFKF